MDNFALLYWPKGGKELRRIYWLDIYD